jgi:hypothetical protein
MKLRAKVVAIFGIALAFMLGLAVLGFPRLVNGVSRSQLFSIARTLGAYLAHDIESIPFGGDEAAFEKSIDSRLEYVQSLGETSGNYVVRMAMIIGPDFKVEVGHPDSVLGAD